jgi:NTP pyrophosphatase (non-canonical NTP hydrolase)
MPQTGQLAHISEALQAFADSRDWQQFHSPKNLAMALNVEAGELLEHFQWLTEQQSREPDSKSLHNIAREIADVQIYLIRLADQLGIDILASVGRKMLENEQKYPADQVRGSARKYTEY